MTFEIIDRPERNRRSMHNGDMQWDTELEAALIDTLNHGRAIKVRLSTFHSTPAKGRIYKKGLFLKHRVLEDKEHVAAWVEKEPDTEPDYTGEELPLGFT